MEEVFEILLARGLSYFTATSSAGPSSALLNSIRVTRLAYGEDHNSIIIKQLCMVKKGNL